MCVIIRKKRNIQDLSNLFYSNCINLIKVIFSINNSVTFNRKSKINFKNKII